MKYPAFVVPKNGKMEAKLASLTVTSEDENHVLVLNCSKHLPSEELIKEIIGKELPPAQKVSENIEWYPWTIENKYYCADIKLLVVKNKEDVPSYLTSVGKKVNGLLVVFDQTEQSFELVKNCLASVELPGISVLLLISSKYEENAGEKSKHKPVLPRLQVVEWCIEHSFEFIDLNEEIDPEDDFPDTVGFRRVVQALQATEWTKLQLKEMLNRQTHPSFAAGSQDSSGSQVKGDVNDDGKTDEKCASSSESSSTAFAKSKTTEDHNFLNDFDDFGDMFDGATDGELNDDASFEQLFSRMRSMKEKAQSLPPEERKAYAEQVAVAFWRAIGGDEDEIKELDEDVNS